jgi:PD-(D/E)XK endonuclease
MKRITQKKGDLAVSRAIFAFTKRGFDISLPITESAAYDIVVDNSI